MVGARSAAMAFNRIVDADIDARNPRTRMRHMPAGLLSARFAWGFVVVSVAGVSARRARAESAVLQAGAGGSGDRLLLFVHQALHRVFAPGAGLSLGIAPAAAWIAVRGSLDPRILWLTAAVTFWTAGFDIIYSCQDYEFDSRRRPVQPAAPARHRRRPVDRAAAARR